MTTKVFIAYLSICAAVVVGCGVIRGGGVGKCPADAVCGYVNIQGENIYVCAAPAQMQRLKLRATAINAEQAK